MGLRTILLLLGFAKKREAKQHRYLMHQLRMVNYLIIAIASAIIEVANAIADKASATVNL